MADSLDWRPWGTEAFSRAHATRRPVLLVVVTSWSAACRAMDDHVFSDPRVVRLVHERLVAVRVDADRRPDIADRYGAGGWPTTLFLTADGDPLCGGTYVDADRLAGTIVEVSDRCRRDPDGIRGLSIEARRARAQAQGQAQSQVQSRAQAGAAVAVQSTSPDGAGAQDDRASAGAEDAETEAEKAQKEGALSWIAGRLLDAYDPEHGGFSAGGGAKFPLAAPVAFALEHGRRTGDEVLVDAAMTTLDRMAWGGGSDEESGAFHRACARADWTEPDGVHLLDQHADMLRLYLDAWVITGADRYRARARSLWTFVDGVLHDREHGGFFNSAVSAGDDEDGVGSVDRVLLTDANAKMIRALLHASHLLETSTFAEIAARAAERLLPAVYGRGAGVAHVLDSHARVRGLLSDQVHASAAALDLGLVTGDRTYLDVADELMRSCLRKLWDADPMMGGGAFTDRLRSSAGAGDVGLLAEPLRPFALNAEAARLLERLGQETNHPEFLARAADLRAWLARSYQREDMGSIEYGLTLLDR